MEAGLLFLLNLHEMRETPLGIQTCKYCEGTSVEKYNRFLIHLSIK